jgi:hypothetical protein
LTLHSTSLTYTDPVPEKQELHINKIDEEVKIKLILLDVSDDTYEAGKGARILLGTEWRLEIHHAIGGSHDRDFILMWCDVIQVTS